MKKIIFVGSILALGVLLGAPEANAAIATATANTSTATLVAASTNGLVVEGCIVSASTSAANTFTLQDGDTAKVVISVPAATSKVVDFKEIFKEEWLVSGILKVKATTTDTGARITCSTKPRRAN